jgi:hypothetical protein
VESSSVANGNAALMIERIKAAHSILSIMIGWGVGETWPGWVAGRERVVGPVGRAAIFLENFNFSQKKKL